MARVFSPEEVKQGRVPTLEAFPLVVDEVRRRFNELDGVLGAVLCGSIMEPERHSRRMDLDCFVLYRKPFDATDPIVENDLAQLRQWSAEWHVPLSFICREWEVVEVDLFDGFDADSEYDFAPYFLRHLEWATVRGGVIKTNPIPQFLEYSEWDIKDEANEIIAYCESKLWYFGVRPGMGSDRCVPRFLTQVVSAPFHAARKTIEFFSRLAGDEAVDVHQLNKKEVLRECDRILPVDAVPASVIAALERLVAIDVLYDEVLEQSLICYDAARYQWVLQEIERAIPQAVRFVDDCRSALFTAAY